MARSVVSFVIVVFALLLIGFAVSPSHAVGKYVMAWWREQGEYENAGCQGNHILHVHVFDEYGNPKPNVRIMTTWGVELGVTEATGEARVVLDVNNSLYEFVCQDSYGSLSDTAYPVTTRRWPCWGHYSYDVGFLYKADSTSPGSFDTGLRGTVNLADSNESDAPCTNSLTYYSTNPLVKNSDAFALGNFQSSSSWFGQTFKATGDRIVAIQTHATRGGTDQLSYYFQILEGGPNGTPVSAMRNTGMVWPNQQTEQAMFFGVDECHVVPGQTYFLKIWQPSTGMNAYRVSQSNYADGVYYEGNTPYSGFDLKGLVVCMTYSVPNSGSLKVNITPQGAVDAGAQWRRVGTSTWRNSGTTETNVPAGSYTVEFKDDIAGWAAPSSQSVNIAVGQTTAISAAYTQTMYVVSYISTFNGSWSGGPIGPHPAGWTYAGYGPPAYSQQEQVFVLPPNDGTNSAYRFNLSGMTSASGSMVMHMGERSLESFALPDMPINWNYPVFLKTDVYAADYGTNTKWETVLTVFNYERTSTGIVEWGNNGHANSEWVTLATEIAPNQPGKIGLLVLFTNFDFVGKTFSQVNTSIWENVRMEYVPVSAAAGSLQVTISPQEAVDAGAQWRRTGTSEWRNSGYTETNVPVGQHTVEFKAVSGWTTPANQNVTIYGGQTTTASANYARDCPAMSIAQALSSPNGTCLTIADRVVTAGTSEIGGAFYVEEADRSAGIRIATSVAVARGDRVTVAGVMEMGPNGERRLGASDVQILQSAQTVPDPLFFLNRELGGAAYGPNTPGVFEGLGLYNVGLLVTCAGRITASGSGYFYIDDGSALADGSGNVGVRVDAAGLTNPTGSYAVVTGISTMCKVGANSVRAIRPRSQADIVGL